MKFLVLNGPNLNLLGTREKSIYGEHSLETINACIDIFAKQAGHEVTFEQSNIEGVLVDVIQQASGEFDGIVMNPAAYTHTSVAIRDAILAVAIPVVEVHLSVPSSREDFRQINMLADVVVGRVEGFGGDGYTLALQGLIRHLEEKEG
jgi:3-dehydroquinate dehydratase-2